MKKAQSGSSAGLLVLMIGIVMILYILFLPPDVREDLIGDNNGKNVSTKTVTANKGILLDENPGTLLESKNLKFEHKLPSFNLFTRTEDTVLKEVQSVYISSEKDALSRSIPLLLKGRTTNVQLSMNIVRHSGMLTILLNGDEIFSGEAKGIFTPIRLENLQEENVIEFKVQPVGWMFWKKNYYELSDIKLTGTVETYSSREATTTFIISREEKSNLKEAYLLYLPDCKTGQTERLSVYLNDLLISSKVPDCGSPEKIILDPDDLREGRNELKFFAEKGTYLVDQVVVKTELREPIYPVYFFEVNETRYTLVKNNTLKAVLTMSFVDDKEKKAAALNINNIRTFLDTRSDRYNKTINDFIVEDSNFIRIEPQTNLPIINLRIELK
ncbi:MAG: hypothetical protein V1702_02690 [Candidatus Woesearchaeota archaeon]